MVVKYVSVDNVNLGFCLTIFLTTHTHKLGISCFVYFVQTSPVADFGKSNNNCHTCAGGVYEKILKLRYDSLHRFISSSVMSMPFNVVCL